MQWIETGVNAKIKNIEMPDGSFAIGIIGITAFDYAWQKALSELNFKVSVSGRVLLRQGTIRFSEVKAMFPNAKIADLDKNDVFIYRKKPADRTISQDSQSVVFLGKNYLGQEVYQSAIGSRFIKPLDVNAANVSEDGNLAAGLFLKAVNPGDIELCADGFIVRAETEYLRPQDLKLFCGIIHGETKPVETSDLRLREAQEAIEAAFNRRVNKHFKLSANKDLHELFKFAENLQSRLPNMIYRTSESIALQQYSTPATLSIAAQYALGNVAGQRVLEPTIGNASLVTTLEGATVFGVEIDQKRFDQTKLMLNSDNSYSGVNLIKGDFLSMEFDEPFDAIIANPPFGGLGGSVLMDGLSVTRRDQQILMQTLRFRKENGRALFIIGADYESNFKGKEGELSGGSEKLFNWLTDHYEINAFEVSGDLYKSQGAGYALRFIAVGRKRSSEEAKEALKTKIYRIKKLPVVTTNEELWAAASETREFFANIAPSDAEQEANLELVNIEIGKELKENPEFGNDYQAQYIPMTAGSSNAMIPKNLVVPQSRAFAKFIDENGDPENFVKKELRLTDLSDFEPEQIDAIAMGIWNMQRGRALILADQTGMGKGRVVAAISRWSAMNEIQCNFLTEKAGLFSDLWRDVMDIHSEKLFTPFILNDGEKIVSLSGSDQETLVPRTNKAITDNLVTNQISPKTAGYNLMVATYSQFNRNGSNKALFLEAASKDAILVMDEAHNAAGESNTGGNLTLAIEQSKGVIYSSATYAKNFASMGIYSKAFPSSVNINNLKETLHTGGEGLQEVLSSMLCEDGVLLRREHDLSHLKFSTINPDEETLQRNITISDKVANVLQIMAYISGDIEKTTKKINKKLAENLKNIPKEQRQGGRIGVSYVNFGSRLYNIMRQLSLILSADMVANQAIKSLENGQKPVVVLEQTMESVLNELILKDEESESQNNQITPLTLKHLLTRLLYKIQFVTRRNDYGEMETVSIFDLPENNGSAKQSFDDLMSFIESTDEFNIIAMPLDVIAQKIRDAGYTIGEVSGRAKSYVFNEQGMAVPDTKKREKNKEIFSFNSGEYDAVILTRSGCTGISLHAGPKFADQRQRVLIEAQIAQNVNERVQFFGRVNRRGQLSVPEILSITSGLTWENRALAMQNIKLRRLSANTQSDRNNAAEIKDITDILNVVGDEVCREYLQDHQELAAIFNIDVNEDENRSGDSGSYFVSKMTLRICLFSDADQKKIYKEWADEYDKKIEDLTRKGINPLETKILDVKARVIDKKTVISGVADGSVFDQPVYAEKIEWEKEVDPIRSDYIIKSANASIRSLAEAYGFDADSISQSYSHQIRKFHEYTDDEGNKQYFLTPSIKEWIEKIDLATKKAIRFAVPDTVDGLNTDEYIRQQINSDEPNHIKRIHFRSELMKQNLPKLLPGSPIMLTVFDDATQGVVLHISPAKEGREHLPGEYNMMIAIPGQKETEKVSLNGLLSDKNFKTMEYHYSEVYNVIDTCPAGKQVFSRWTLTGNLFRAAEIAANSELGTVGLYTTHDGNRHRAVICRPVVNYDDLVRSNVSVNKDEAIERIISAMDENPYDKVEFSKVATLTWFDHGRTIKLTVPGSRAQGGQFFSNERITNVMGEFVGTRTAMSASADDNENKTVLKEVVSAIYDLGHSLKISVKQIKSDNDKNTQNNEDDNGEAMRQSA